jgi:hypothetical protein
MASNAGHAIKRIEKKSQSSDDDLKMLSAAKSLLKRHKGQQDHLAK